MKPTFINHTVLDPARMSPVHSAADQALKIVSSKIHERMASTAGAVTGGMCKDFSEYRHLCGILQGLALADREIHDLIQAMEQGNDD